LPNIPINKIIADYIENENIRIYQVALHITSLLPAYLR
jgi:tetrahydromethanopterin S-methyltransferase subunit A